MLLNIGMIIVSPIPCSLPFYTTIAIKSYILLNSSERKFLYILYQHRGGGRVNPLYVNHFSVSHLQILMQLLVFVCLDMDVTYAYYQLNNFNGLRNISSFLLYQKLQLGGLTSLPPQCRCWHIKHQIEALVQLNYVCESFFRVMKGLNIELVFNVYWFYFTVL